MIQTDGMASVYCMDKQTMAAQDHCCLIRGGHRTDSITIIYKHFALMSMWGVLSWGYGLFLGRVCSFYPVLWPAQLPLGSVEPSCTPQFYFTIKSKQIDGIS